MYATETTGMNAIACEALINDYLVYSLLKSALVISKMF